MTNDRPFADIGARLRLLRLAHGYKNQRHFAKLLGAGPTQYNNWEKGAARIPVAFALEMRKLTGGDLQYIYDGALSGLPAVLVSRLDEISSSGTDRDDSAA